MAVGALLLLMTLLERLGGLNECAQLFVAIACRVGLIRPNVARPLSDTMMQSLVCRFLSLFIWLARVTAGACRSRRAASAGGAG